MPARSSTLRRILASGLAAAALAGGVLGTASPAQAPEAEATPAATAIAIAEAPITTPAAATPAATAEAPPAEIPAPAATEEPTPFAPPAETATATPDPTPAETPAETPAPTADPSPAAEDATAAPTPDATPRPDRPRRRPTGTTESGEGDVDADCSGSTGRRGCGADDGGADDACAGDDRRRSCGEPREPGPRGAAGERDPLEADSLEVDRDDAPVLADAPPRAAIERADGSPAPAAPGYALATPGPARIGVPSFFIDKFRIPPFLLPIYQAAGMEYGIRWEILAAINEIETDYGRNLAVSSAGALGWMQFMPPTWEAYGVDANRDGVKDPFNPVDAIFAAARYLRASGAETDIRAAVFAYNHADWYVDSVLMRARVIGGLPQDLVGSLTGLTEGRFPVHAKATYAARPEGTGTAIFSRPGAPVIAVNDGRVVRLGRNEALGRFAVLRDVHGNTYTYAGLGELAETHPVPEHRGRDLRPAPLRDGAARPAPGAAADDAPARKERLFANPTRPAARAAGGAAQLPERAAAGVPAGPVTAPIGFDPRDFVARPLEPGVRVIAGTVLGRLGPERAGRAPRLRFSIRPAGRGTPEIDAKPILDGWKLLETTAVYRAAGRNPFFGDDARDPSVGQLLLLPKEQLIRRVLADSRVEVYDCGREDIRTGQVDRRVLATLLYLAASGLKPTVSSLKCGHGYYTASGNVSHHSTGTAVDIAAVNGIVITPATQGPGSITDLTIRRLLDLQGSMEPAQIISLMTFAGEDNTLAMGDHGDHIHVGWSPAYGEGDAHVKRRVDAVLKPDQWMKLVDRLGRIDNPEVSAEPSRYAITRRGTARRAP